jgi:hypothetical protein
LKSAGSLLSYCTFLFPLQLLNFTVKDSKNINLIIPQRQRH